MLHFSHAFIYLFLSDRIIYYLVMLDIFRPQIVRTTWEVRSWNPLAIRDWKRVDGGEIEIKPFQEFTVFDSSNRPKNVIVYPVTGYLRVDKEIEVEDDRGMPLLPNENGFFDLKVENRIALFCPDKKTNLPFHKLIFRRTV